MRRRLLLSNFVLIGVTLALLSFTAFQATRRSFETFRAAHTAVHTQVLMDALEQYYVAQQGWEGVQNEIVSLSLVSGYVVTVVDVNGELVANTLGRGAEPVNQDGALFLELALTAAQTPIGTAYVDQSVELEAVDASFSDDLVREFLPSAFIVLGLAVVLGVFLARSITQPLVEMQEAAVEIAQGRYGVQIEAQRPDEIGALGRAFNQMAAGLADVERMRRELVMNVSHDLRTPLTIIKGYLDGLLNGQIADRRSAEQAFAAMNVEVNHLLHLVDDLNEVARLDAGNVVAQRELADVNMIVEEVMMRARPLAERKQIALTADVAAGLPAVRVDASQIGQMLFNLVENGVRHTAAGGRVNVAAMVLDQQLVLVVEDDGEGIAAEHQTRIFERFYRVDPTRHGEGAGSGLGLAIAAGVAEMHGGQITVESEEKRGSRFTITLPKTNL